MKRVVFWFDVISPFAYLAFERLPQALEGCSYEVEYRPVVFGALLKHWAHKGPAEIEPKRQWTFRHVHWLAREHGLTLHTPAAHPFNPLPLLRLAVACSAADLTPNRYVVEQVFRHVWQADGQAATEPQRLAVLRERLAPAREPDSDAVKSQLRSYTEEAMACGVFGVPTFELEGRLFWGFDSLPMLAAALRGDPWFHGPDWDREGAARPGVVRG